MYEAIGDQLRDTEYSFVCLTELYVEPIRFSGLFIGMILVPFMSYSIYIQTAIISYNTMNNISKNFDCILSHSLPSTSDDPYSASTLWMRNISINAEWISSHSSISYREPTRGTNCSRWFDLTETNRISNSMTTAPVRRGKLIAVDTSFDREEIGWLLSLNQTSINSVRGDNKWLGRNIILDHKDDKLDVLV